MLNVKRMEKKLNRFPKAIRNMALFARIRAAQLGLFGGHDDYTRFVIVGQGRTGSNFLRGLLNSHAQILTYGELFRNYGHLHPDLAGIRPTHRTLRLSREDPVRFLETKVFCSMPKHIKAVGFKLFYNHAREPQWRPLWTHLGARQSLKVIHILRRNALETFASLKRAFKTNDWKSERKRAKDVLLELDYDECLQAFEDTERWQRQFRSEFRNREVLEVDYDILVKNTAHEMRRVQHFLGVEETALRPSTFKQSSLPLTKGITNYQQLKERFASTQWSAYFED